MGESRIREQNEVQQVPLETGSKPEEQESGEGPRAVEGVTLDCCDSISELPAEKDSNS